MSAVELRQAAAFLRKRASEASRPSPWVAAMGQSWGGENAVCEGDGHPLAFVGDGDQADADCHYIATMHPGVGFEVANWLDEEAGKAEEFAARGKPHFIPMPALAVAAALMNEVPA